MRRLLLAALVLAGAVARADHAQAPFDSQQFHPTTTARGYLGVDGAFPVRHLGFTAGLFGTYGHLPLAFRDQAGAVPPGGRVIEHQLGFSAVGSFGIIDRLELGVALPFVAYQATDGSLLGFAHPVAAAGLGDVRFDLKALIVSGVVRARHRLGLSLIAGLRLPSGDADSFLGQGGVSGHPRFVAEWVHPRAAVAVNLGAVLRSSRSYGDLHVTHQISWAVAGRVPIGLGFEALGELRGLVGVGYPDGSPGLTTATAPIELAVGGRFVSRLGIAVSLAGGAGLTRGYGTPDGRLIFGLRYETPPGPSRPVDTDGDGVLDSADRCPRVAGVVENFGCPEPDTDGDGVVDRLDSCPEEPGEAALGGCPDRDSDGDGLVDRRDRCPTEPGRVEDGGCPPPDRDKDGVLDVADRCPDVAGVPENDGCPDIDSDGDGLVDRLDKCPFDAEIINGNADEDGCPDAGPWLARLEGDRIEVRDPIVFVEPGGAIDRRSTRSLQAVASLLKMHREIRKVRIEGHTDNRGSAIDNLDRSRRRAAAVRRALVELGIDGERLHAQGYGPDRPIADNATAAGREKNRRIELVVVERQER